MASSDRGLDSACAHVHALHRPLMPFLLVEALEGRTCSLWGRSTSPYFSVLPLPSALWVPIAISSAFFLVQRRGIS